MPVVIKGVDATRRALAKFSPDLYKELNDEIRPILSGMAREAKSMVPPYFLSGVMNDGRERKSRTNRKRAFPVYDSAQIRRGLTYSMGSKKSKATGWVSTYALLNKSAMGAIIETAGRLNPAGDPASQSNNPNAGQNFIAHANRIGSFKKVGESRKDQGRLAFAAVANNRGRATQSIIEALAKAEKKYKAATS